MKAIRIEPGKEPRVVDVLARTIEKALDDMVHEEVLPIEGTMSLSALRTDGLESNDLMADRTGDDGYYGTVYICAVWYEDLSQDQINDVLDWLEGEPIEKDYTVDAWLFEDPSQDEGDEDEWI
jgi:hypothetical protein